MTLIERPYRNAQAMDLFGKIFVLTDDKTIQKDVIKTAAESILIMSCCPDYVL